MDDHSKTAAIFRAPTCARFKMMVLVVLWFSLHVGTVQGSTRNVVSDLAEDEVIKSKNFPKPYPRDFNMTWEWRVPQGHWAVIFVLFDLDPDDSDWIEITESTKTVRYHRPSSLPPPYQIISGPDFSIHFHSNHYTQPTTKGFEIRVLYSDSREDIVLRCSQVVRELAKESRDKETTAGATVVVGVAVCMGTIVVVFIFALIYWKMRKKERRGGSVPQRDAFGVRRDSGVSHTRDERRRNGSQEASSPTNQHPTRGQLGLHRQDSGRTADWITRAEMTTTIQTAGREPRPNIYTPALGEGASGGAQARPGLSRQASREQPRGRPPSGQSSSAQRPRDLAVHQCASGGETSPKKSLSRSNSGATRSKPRKDGGGARAADTRAGEKKMPALSTQYSDTADCVQPVVVDQDEPASPYHNVPLINLNSPKTKKSQLDLSPPPYSPTSSDNCYANFQPGLGNAQPPRANSQTNIYINTNQCSAAAVGSSGSLNNIFINTADKKAQCTSENFTLQNPDNVNRGQEGARPNTSITNLHVSPATPRASPTNPRRTGNQANNNNTKESTPAPTVQIVDGYAYIVPGESMSEPTSIAITNAGVTNAHSDWSVQTSSSMRLGVVPEAVRASQLANENGYIDFPGPQRGQTEV